MAPPLWVVVIVVRAARERIVAPNVGDVIESSFFPAFRWALKPSSDLAKRGAAVEVASLERLYYVFERC